MLITTPELESKPGLKYDELDLQTTEYSYTMAVHSLETEKDNYKLDS